MGGKANVYFKTHAECLQAMEKDQQEICSWRVNLYLNSTDDTATQTSQKSKSGQQNKISFDAAEEEPVDDTMNETTEADESTVAADESTSEEPKKKFKWDKV